MPEEFNETLILFGELVGLKSLPKTLQIIKRNVECEIIDSVLKAGKCIFCAFVSIDRWIDIKSSKLYFWIRDFFTKYPFSKRYLLLFSNVVKVSKIKHKYGIGKRLSKELVKKVHWSFSNNNLSSMHMNWWCDFWYLCMYAMYI